MERQTGCPKHGVAEIKKNLNDYICVYDEGKGICGYKLNKVETANYIQIKSEATLQMIKEHQDKTEIILNDNKLQKTNPISLVEFKKNIEIKSWYLIDKYFETSREIEKAKMAVLTLNLLLKEKQLKAIHD